MAKRPPTPRGARRSEPAEPHESRIPRLNPDAAPPQPSPARHGQAAPTQRTSTERRAIDRAARDARVRREAHQTGASARGTGARRRGDGDAPRRRTSETSRGDRTSRATGSAFGDRKRPRDRDVRRADDRVAPQPAKRTARRGSAEVASRRDVAQPTPQPRRDSHRAKRRETSSDQPSREVATPGRTDSPAEVFGRHSRPAEQADHPADQSDTVVTSALELKRSERRREVRKRKRHILLATAGILAILIAVGLALTVGPMFALDKKQITVKGAQEPVEAASIEKIVARHDGTPLPRLNTAALRSEILDGQTWISDAEVDRQYPHGITVKILMRYPVGRWTTAGKQLVAEDGALIPVAGTDASKLPAIVVKDGANVPAKRADGAAVANALSESMRAQVAQISVPKKGAITLTLQSGATVVWGDADDSDLKAQVLETLIQRDAKTYDLTDPMNPTTL